MKMNLATFFIILSIIPIILSADPTVQLPDGEIIGREASTIQGKKYFAFEKIPYAAPPVGDLRFKAPVPPTPWKQPLNTIELDVCCWQLGYILGDLSEDCLYLNVYTPSLSNDSLPVMVFIHGGAFTLSCSMGYQSDFVIDEEVILVTLNFRLGIFGFLSTQDEIIPGNYGLKDQKLAIEWVFKNIHLFGGDPSRITIWGHSSGAASASYQLLNQDLKGKLAGAILQSGTALNPWAFQRNAREIAFKTKTLISDDDFATTPHNNSSQLLEFFQQVSARTLVKVSDYFANKNFQNGEMYHGCTWAPVIEVAHPEAFLTEKMFGLIKNGSTIGVPIIIGMTSEESLQLKRIKKEMSAFDKHLEWLVPDDMNIQNETQKKEVGKQIRDIYTNGEPLVQHVGDSIRLSSDMAFTRSIMKFAELYTKFDPAYFYQFSYHGDLGQVNVRYKNAEHVAHSEDLQYFFCSSENFCDMSQYPKSDQLTVQRVIKLWTNFAKYQNPTPEKDGLLQGITWHFVRDLDLFLYLNINETLSLRNNPKMRTYRKWEALYEKLDYNDFDTY